MPMARRLMAGVYWWMLREHARSRAGFRGDLVNSLSNWRLVQNDAAFLKYVSQSKFSLCLKVVVWAVLEEEVLMSTSNILAVKTMSGKERDIAWKESEKLLVVATLKGIV
jgi:hypothetical protein